MIGVDIISIARIEEAINKWGDKFLIKFLSYDEIQMVRRPKTAAGFWAAKEACAKALGCGICEKLNFHDMQIIKTDQGAPYIKLTNNHFNYHRIHISITHDGGFAMAVALLEVK